MKHSPALLTALLLVLGCFQAACLGVLPAFLFADFEADAGWTAGLLPAGKSGLHLVQGTASVIALPEVQSAQALAIEPSTPFAALFVETIAAATAPVAFCEVLARPAAVTTDADAEFLDFGGAVLGFFRQGTRGELRALFARSAEESVWISTGLTFTLDDAGAAASWLRLGIRLDRRTGRWDLRVDGTYALTGLRALDGRPAALAFWLYGQESQRCLVDDILVSSVAPDQLEKLIEAENRRALRRAILPPTRRAEPRPRLVTRGPAPATLRSTQPAIDRATRTLTAPVLHAWDASLRIGDTTFRSSPEIEINGRKAAPIFYSPRTDDDGRPLPGEVTITADAELRPGTDLGRLRWIVHELIRWPDVVGEVVAAGDFSTGLVQTATIPPEWIRKATTIGVWTTPGSSDVPWWRFRLRSKQPPAAP